LKQKIAECCKRLRLSRNIAEICDHVEAESPQAYLLEILQQEIAYRETARKGRLLKQAGFYAIKTFDGYSFDEIRMPSGQSPGLAFPIMLANIHFFCLSNTRVSW
jgi:hypothetical protein